MPPVVGGMSSRLLTMKFMQRGAAVAAQQPNNAQGEKARARAAIDQAAIQEALKAEAAALEKAKQYSERLVSGTTEDGETRWELSIQKANEDEIEQPGFGEVGYASLLADDGEEEDEMSEDEESDDDSDESETENKGIVKKKRKAGIGRISFGNFNKEVEELHNPTPVVIEAPTVTKEVNIKHLSSISGGQQANTKAAQFGQLKCNICDEKGHFARDCPNKRTARNARDREDRGPRQDNRECHTCGKTGHLMADCPEAITARGRKRKSDGNEAFAGKKRRGMPQF
ncbi:hypothetical protein BJ508DRAFT_410790 [Ascobolus immersus RN42]|uniref:CCHC-type domain-containing protein n=1 Tax=Ascobolus immersus RN42 TaxID=1160509 RepID=A0A3N4IMC8_ASCIM|nr:hypothetical protein BJ508DRAFT_410790 [Ascobolus immersus RN42]